MPLRPISFSSGGNNNSFLEGFGSGSDIVSKLLNSAKQRQLLQQQAKNEKINEGILQNQAQYAPQLQEIALRKALAEREKADQENKYYPQRQESILAKNEADRIKSEQEGKFLGPLRESQIKANDARANRYNNPVSQTNNPSRDDYYKAKTQDLNNKNKAYSYNRLSNAEKEDQISKGVALTGYPRDRVAKDYSEGKTLEGYRKALGVSDEVFNKLSGIGLPEKSIATQQQKAIVAGAGYNILQEQINKGFGHYSGARTPDGYNVKYEIDKIFNKKNSLENQAQYLASKILSDEKAALLLRKENIPAGITALQQLKEDSLTNAKEIYPVSQEVLNRANDIVNEASDKVIKATTKASLNPYESVQEENKKILSGNKKDYSHITDEQLYQIAKNKGIL